MVEERNIDLELIVAEERPRIRAVFEGRTVDLYPEDVLNTGDDLATISDEDLMTRVGNRLEFDFDASYKVTRPVTGNVLISRQSVYG